MARQYFYWRVFHFQQYHSHTPFGSGIITQIRFDFKVVCSIFSIGVIGIWLCFHRIYATVHTNVSGILFARGIP